LLTEDNGGFKPELCHAPLKARFANVVESRYVLERTRYWACRPDALRVRYEDLLSDPAGELRRIADFVDLPASDEEISHVVAWHSFTRRAGRQPGVVDRSSFHRRGIVGEYLSVLDRSDLDHFMAAHDGAWARLLRELGYS
jgi:hypothetical protein